TSGFRSTTTAYYVQAETGLIDMFVELFEGQEAERSISRMSGEDFRAAIARWLDGALQTRRDGSKRQLRRRDAKER
ncbi:MAG: hypothetical protein ACRD1V_17745, partial [Vicinamibacterales bacterium]